MAPSDQSKTDFFAFLVTNRTVFDLFFAALSPANIIRFSWTSRSSLAAVQSYMMRTYDVDKYLSRYFPSRDLTQSFRQLQARTGLLVSGSSALQFMDRISYDDSDLDLYVDRRFGLEVGSWLGENGYTYRPPANDGGEGTTPPPATFTLAFNEAYEDAFPQPAELAVVDPLDDTAFPMPYSMRGIARVFDFYMTQPDGERKVQLILAWHAPLAIILHFHSTCVMNMISDSAAYSLHPHATFEERRSLLCSIPGRHKPAALLKYINRGWSMVSVLTPSEMVDTRSSLASGSRSVGDRHCWVIPLSPLPLSSPSHGDALTIATWSMDHHLPPPEPPQPNPGPTQPEPDYPKPTATISFNILCSRALQWNYPVANDRLLAHIWPFLRDAEARGGGVSHCDTLLVQICKAYHAMRSWLDRIPERA